MVWWLDEAGDKIPFLSWVDKVFKWVKSVTGEKYSFADTSIVCVGEVTDFSLV